MRIYSDAYELMSEIFREVFEMGHLVHPHSMQNKRVKDVPEFSTKEITNYSYCLLKLHKRDYLFLSDMRSKQWVVEEFNERVSEFYINPGVAWTIRKDVWEQFLNSEGKFDYSYNERMRVSLNKVIDELSTNPDSRQAIISIWNPEIDSPNLGGKRRVPCSIYYQVFIRKNMVHLVYNQRSADVITHFGNDVALAWLLKDYIAEKLGYDTGYLYHNIGSLHCYRKDWGKLKECIEDIKSKVNG